LGDARRLHVFTTTKESGMTITDNHTITIEEPILTTEDITNLPTVEQRSALMQRVERLEQVVEVAGGTLFGDARRCSCTLWGRSAYWDGDGS
jgi:hypothetical protein